MTTFCNLEDCKFWLHQYSDTWKRQNEVEQYLEVLVLKAYEWAKAVTETESLVVRGLKLESKILVLCSKCPLKAIKWEEGKLSELTRWQLTLFLGL